MMSDFYSPQAIEQAKKNYLTVVIFDNADGDDGYVAFNPQLDGCMSQGETPEEAIENLLDARTLYIDSLIEESAEIPEPAIANNIHIVSNFTGFISYIPDDEPSSQYDLGTETSSLNV